MSQNIHYPVSKDLKDKVDDARIAGKKAISIDMAFLLWINFGGKILDCN